jgi:hypothetical protein
MVFVLVKAPLTAGPCSEQDFKRRRNTWYVLTLSAFLAHNFWLFILVATAGIVYALRTESNRYALYLGLMLALPHLTASIPGLGVVNQIFAIDQLRLLALVILLPAYLSLRRHPGVEPFGALWCDRLLIGIFLAELLLTVPYRSLTSVVRDSILYKFTDVFLTYYVASRSLRSVKAFRDALGAFVLGALVFSAVLVFESVRNWLLYRAVDDALGVVQGFGGIYLRRAGLLRAEGTAGQAIVAGYTCAVAMGLFLYVGSTIKSLPWRTLCWLILLGGIVGALSRAPWLGAAMMLFVYILFGPSPGLGLLKLFGALLACLPVAVFTGFGSTIIDFLPWVGTVDAGTVEGRERLTTVAMKVISENLWFGNYDYGTLPALEVLRDGSGIIDLVNTYIIIALKGGIVSLGLFAGCALAAVLGLIDALWRVRDRRDERHGLGRALLATLSGVLFVIATVSPIFFVYPIYWSLVGLSVGFRRLVLAGEVQAGSAARVATDGRRFDGSRGQAGVHSARDGRVAPAK